MYEIKKNIDTAFKETYVLPGVYIIILQIKVNIFIIRDNLPGTITA